MKKIILVCPKCKGNENKFYGSATGFRTEYYDRNLTFTSSSDSCFDEVPDELYCSKCESLAEEVEVEVEDKKPTQIQLFRLQEVNL